MRTFFDINIQLPLDRFDLSLEFQSSQNVLGLFGPSGCGKSSTLQTIAGLRSAKGRIQCGDTVFLDSQNQIELSPAQRNVGYVPQDHCLFPHWNVYENLRAGKQRAERTASDFEKRFNEVVDLLELEPLLKRKIDQLSGGERQRIALGRALCSMPQLLLLDEPMASLDAGLRERIIPYLIRVRDEFKIPMIIVSHNRVELQALCKEIVIIENGKSIAQGPPLSIFTEAGLYKKTDLTPYENILDVELCETQTTHTKAKISGTAESTETLTLPTLPRTPTQSFKIGIAANELLLSIHPATGLSARNCLKSTITRIEILPNACLVIAQLNEPTGPCLAIELTQDALEELKLQPNQTVYLIFKSSAVRLYL